MSPPAGDAQASANDELGYLLREYKHNHAKGSALNETVHERYIRLTNSRRLADRAIWAGLGRQPDSKQDIPTIAVEFVSPGRAARRRGYVDKRPEYLDAGIQEYWVIDRFDRTMTVFTRRPDQPAERVVTASEAYQTDLLPGFELPVARLFREADAWNKI